MCASLVIATHSCEGAQQSQNQQCRWTASVAALLCHPSALGPTRAGAAGDRPVPHRRLGRPSGAVRSLRGGALSDDGQRWIPAKPGFLFPVRALSVVFRGKYLDALAQGYRRGELHFAGSTAPLADSAVFRGFLASLQTHDWVVYAKAPFVGAEQVNATDLRTNQPRYLNAPSTDHPVTIPIDLGKLKPAAQFNALKRPAAAGHLRAYSLCCRQH